MKRKRLLIGMITAVLAFTMVFGGGVNTKAAGNSQVAYDAIEKGYCARLYKGGNHIYTMDKAEVTKLLSEGYIDETDYKENTFRASLTKTEVFDQPVYRFFNKIVKLHLYTHQESERQVLLKNANWTQDKGAAPVFYTASKPLPGGTGIYRAFKAGKQHYCGKTEYNYLIRYKGYSPNNNDDAYWYTWDLSAETPVKTIAPLEMENLDTVTLSTIKDGVSIDNQAHNKPKLLSFVRTNGMCSLSNNMGRNLASLDLSKIDVIIIDADSSGKSVVQGYKETYCNSKDVQFAYGRAGSYLMWDYARMVGTEGSLRFPVNVYIDANNVVQKIDVSNNKRDVIITSCYELFGINVNK